ncbi:hypothetical protein V8G54_000375 [Vigna mungo]|uniref:Uncharacterized protein n=1 Tax=Vigna mungo TaxID=3915 RepID=A0AAQ3P6F0_VIGMU
MPHMKQQLSIFILPSQKIRNQKTTQIEMKFSRSRPSSESADTNSQMTHYILYFLRPSQSRATLHIRIPTAAVQIKPNFIVAIDQPPRKQRKEDSNTDERARNRTRKSRKIPSSESATRLSLYRTNDSITQHSKLRKIKNIRTTESSKTNSVISRTQNPSS